jgi:hypothetical protein
VAEMMIPNQISGANADGSRQLPLSTGPAVPLSLDILGGMRVACIIGLLTSMSFMASCSRPPSAQPQTAQLRVSDIEQYINENTPRINEG